MGEGKHPGGRPSKYNEKFHPLLVEYLARNGKTDKEMAVLLSISEDTFYEWKKVHKEFSESIKKGKEGIDDQVENALLKRALGFKKNAVKLFQHNGVVVRGKYKEYYPPDVAAAFIWLKNRRPAKWRDKHEIDISGGVEVKNPLYDKLCELTANYKPEQGNDH